MNSKPCRTFGSAVIFLKAPSLSGETVAVVVAREDKLSRTTVAINAAKAFKQPRLFSIL
jgi:hypothetical protein